MLAVILFQIFKKKKVEQQLTHGVDVKEADRATQDPGKHAVVQFLRGVHGHLKEQQCPHHAEDEDSSNDAREDVDVAVTVHVWDGDVGVVVAL